MFHDLNNPPLVMWGYPQTLFEDLIYYWPEKVSKEDKKDQGSHTR